MCIIVAKPAGVKMPDMKIIENCFSNNPDGAGIMYNRGGKVYGFKGFMSIEAFKAKLAQLEKKFGKLTKLNIVMHFRITTHGGSIAANTHPFPVVSSYKDMRELEWVSDLGMAHNGIIGCVDRHIDIKKENVSDTMVFIKRIVKPIASMTNIMKSKKLLETIWLASDSKLAFLDGAGNLKVLGDFVFENGVYYSNTTYSHARPKYNLDSWSGYGWGKGWTISKPSKGSQSRDRVYLSKDDEDYLKITLAQEYGLEILEKDDVIVYEEGYREPVGSMILAQEPGTWSIWEWDNINYDWYELMTSDEYDYIDPNGSDALA
jgi:predicted glutamine amidotransferase